MQSALKFVYAVILVLWMFISVPHAKADLPQRMQISTSTVITVGGGDFGGGHTSARVDAICLDPDRRAPTARDVFNGSTDAQAVGFVICRISDNGERTQAMPLHDVVGKDGWPKSVVFRGVDAHPPYPEGVGLPTRLDIEIALEEADAKYRFEIFVDSSGIAVVGPESAQAGPGDAKHELEKRLIKSQRLRLQRLTELKRLITPRDARYDGSVYNSGVTNLGQAIANGQLSAEEIEKQLSDLESSAARTLQKLVGSDPEPLEFLAAIVRGRRITREDVDLINSYLVAKSRIPFQQFESLPGPTRALIELRESLPNNMHEFVEEFTAEVLAVRKKGFTLSDAIERTRDATLPGACYEVASSFCELTDVELGTVPVPSRYSRRFLGLGGRPTFGTWANRGRLTKADHSVYEYLTQKSLNWDESSSRPASSERFAIEERVDGGDQETVVTAERAKHSSDGMLHMHHLKLGAVDLEGNLRGNGGDGIVIQREFADATFGDAFVVDTSCTISGAKRILNKISANRDGNRRIRLVITHQDKDHIGGLEYLLDEADTRMVEVEEILIGKLPGAKGATWETISRRLDERFKRGIADSPTIGHWIRAGSNTAVVNVEEPESDSLRVLRLKTLDGVHIDVSQIAQPKTTNQTSLVTHLCFQGIRHLLTADGDAAVLAQLSAGSGVKPAGMLKWPHHLWNGGNEEEVKELIRKFKPHTIIISNRHSKHPEAENLAKIKAIVEEVLGKDAARIFYTGQDGDIHVIVDNRYRWKWIFSAFTLHADG